MTESSKAPVKRTAERRGSDRRVAERPFPGEERRQCERRSGHDRRVHD